MLNYLIHTMILYSSPYAALAAHKIGRKRRKRTVRMGPVPFDLLPWAFTYVFGRGVPKIRRKSYARGRITDGLMP